MARGLVLVWGLALVGGRPARAQDLPLIAEVLVEQEGAIIRDPVVLGLIETTTGEPFSVRDVRDTVAHLTSLDRYEDVRVFRDSVPAGVRVRYQLMPLHPVDRMAFRGTLGLSEGDLRDAITERFGQAPSSERLDEVVEAIRLFYSTRGYPAARIAPHIEETHAPDRATMAFDITAGMRARIARVDIVTGDPQPPRSIPGPGIRPKGCKLL